LAVKRSSSAARMLSVFEALAQAQPIGVSALARRLDADKSAIQRDLMTLADAGWIRNPPGASGQWELAPHVLTLARPPHSSDRLRLLARPHLDRLRIETGETAYLAIPDGDHFIVLAAAESDHPLRIVSAIGIEIPMRGSATGRAVLPYLAPDEQARLWGGEVPADLACEFALARDRGYAVNDEEIQAGAVAIAAPVLDPAGQPIATFVLTGPAERLGPERRERFGPMLGRAARQLAQDID